MNRVIVELRNYLRYLFDLKSDSANYETITNDIYNGVEFKGTNLWILFFAIIICSVGLNVNSTAVIIGAMLISPLMGPILGIGYGYGINDFELIKKAAKNLAIAVFISVTASTFYFILTPYCEAQSELLARTTPTTWDVFIAFFGGLAGIIGITRKGKGNVIPGVAIATALMPPLCTAGYGISQMNYKFFAGAFYLFFINSVFISLATFLIIRFLKFPLKSFNDEVHEKRVKLFVSITVIVTIIPSIFIGYNLIKQSIFDQGVANFIKQEIETNKTFVITKDVDYQKKSIKLYTTGNVLDSSNIATLNDKLANYGLANSNLSILQTSGSNKVDLDKIKLDIVKDLYLKNNQSMVSKDEQIEALTQKLNAILQNTYPVTNIGEEAYALFPNVEAISISQNSIFNVKSEKLDTSILVFTKLNKIMPISESIKFENWIKTRIQNDSTIFIYKN